MPTSNHGWCQIHMGIWSILVADWSHHYGYERTNNSNNVLS